MNRYKLILPERYPFDITEGTEFRIRKSEYNKEVYAGIIGGVEIGIIDSFKGNKEIIPETYGRILNRISKTEYEIEIVK